MNLKYDPSSYFIYTIREDGKTLESVVLSDCCVVTSIDPAPKNFALRIEKRYASGQVETVYMDTVDFCRNVKNVKVEPRMLNRIVDHLDSLEPWIQESNIIAVERQMSKNYISSRIYQHIITYFMLKIKTYPSTCFLIDISAKLKSKVLQAPSGLSYYGLKKWSIEKSLELLEQRGDEWSVNKIKAHRDKVATKADDLADTVIQIEAWFRYINRTV